MCSIPGVFTCFSWNVQQHARANAQCTSVGLDYDTYLITTVVGFVQQAESSAVVISLQGLCTTTFQLLKRELHTIASKIQFLTQIILNNFNYLYQK